MRSALLAAAMFLTPLFSHAAGGAWDGIYSCNFNVFGTTQQVYLTINGYPDGRAIFAVAAATPVLPFYGYGIGNVSDGIFSGNTMVGLPFHATATAEGFTGTLTTILNNQTLTLSGNCTKVW